MTLRWKRQEFENACIQEHYDYRLKYHTLCALRNPDVEVEAIVTPHTRSLFHVNLETRLSKLCRLQYPWWGINL